MTVEVFGVADEPVPLLDSGGLDPDPDVVPDVELVEADVLVDPEPVMGVWPEVGVEAPEVEV